MFSKVPNVSADLFISLKQVTGKIEKEVNREASATLSRLLWAQLMSAFGTVEISWAYATMLILFYLCKFIFFTYVKTGA